MMLRAAGEGVLIWNADPRLKDELSDYRVIDGTADEAMASYQDEFYGGK